MQGPSMAMVGRTAEVRILDGLVAGLAAGTGATLLVEGEGGIGKSQLLRRLVESAHRHGITVFLGAARLFEATRPFGALAEALALRSGSPDPRRAAIAELLSGKGADRGVASSASRSDFRYRIIEEIVELVEVTSGEGPVLLALEDLHWADDSTALAFRSMMRHFAQLPILLVATLRPSPRSTSLETLVDEAHSADVRVLALDPLTSEDAAEMVRVELGAAPSPELAEVVRRAAGNPLWVVEILRSLSAEGLIDLGPGSAQTTATELPRSFRELVYRRLRYLPDATLSVLRAAAVLGDRFSLVDLATVTGGRAFELLEDLMPALRAKLLGEQGTTLAFRHQLVHDAIYEDIPQAARVALHRDAARVLTSAGAPLSQVATHVIRGAVRGDIEAVRVLREAARDVLAQAPDVAIDMLTHAEALLPADHVKEEQEITVDLVEALLRAGRVAACAARAEERLAGIPASHVDARVRLSLISALSLQNKSSELLTQTEAALAVPDLSMTDRALVLAQASYGRTFSGDPVGGEATARDALDLAQRSRDAGMEVWCLTTLSFAVKTQGRYTEAVALTQAAVRRAFEAPDEQGRLRHPHFFLAMALCDADLISQARDAYEHALKECAVLRSSWIAPDVQQLLGELLFLAGEWDDAAIEIDAGLASAVKFGNQVPIAQSRGYRAVIAVARGEQGAAKAVLGPLLPELEQGWLGYGSEVAAYALSMLAEAEGKPSRALDLLWRYWRTDAERQTRRYHRHLAASLVRLAVVLGQTRVAAEVTDDVEAAVGLDPEVASIRGLALRCRGLVECDPDRLLAAIEQTRVTRRLPDHAGTCEDAAAVLAFAGRTSEAQDLLLEALDAHERMGATSWAARTRASLRELGVRHGVHGPRARPETGWDSVTQAERGIAVLVAEGLTNREIAARLYISPHTVNTHLRHLFQKLGVSSRAGLTAITVRRHQQVP